ncbi:MAG: hypothetical protein FRX49_03357 [Trebouxia sp. A1-2]|nr:MAG: hypothetical protein FRX49_03357 [Trebouxia sp. A1-2]
MVSLTIRMQAHTIQAGEAPQTTRRSDGALPALVAPYAAYCGVGMPSAPAPSMLKMCPPEHPDPRAANPSAVLDL